VRPRGQALAEYLVIAAVLATALIAPWPGGRSTGELLLDSLARWYRTYAFVLATS
jgi:hypothetical protein